MNANSSATLESKHCVPCEGGVPTLTAEEVQEKLSQVEGWQVTADGKRIGKDYVLKNFMAGIHFFDKVAEVAETEGHHPDVHLEGYRNGRIEIWTHAIGGLSENDFILAAKIDRLPVDLKQSSK